jgi:hypothetical protein
MKQIDTTSKDNIKAFLGGHLKFKLGFQRVFEQNIASNTCIFTLGCLVMVEC